VGNSERRITASRTMVSDWQPQCGSCGGTAEVFLQIHAVDHCTPDRPSWSKLLCRTCLKVELDRVVEILVEGEPGVVCKTCRLTMVAMSDIVIRICPLWSIGKAI